MKVWQIWPGAHIFCCDGRIMVGPDIKVTMFAAGLTTATCVAFWILVCPYLPMAACTGQVVFYLLTIAFMVATATTDPGIVPRNSSIDDATAAANAQANRFIEVNGEGSREGEGREAGGGGRVESGTARVVVKEEGGDWRGEGGGEPEAGWGGHVKR